MLYKNILFVGLSVYATLSTLSSGATYHVYSNSTTRCAAAAPNDHCIFHADDSSSKFDFDCGNAGICDIICIDDSNCLNRAIINATNASQLNVIVGAGRCSNCYMETTFYLPAFGNANFTVETYDTNQNFREMIVHSGLYTKNIYIECAKGDQKSECQDMQVYAETAESLYINVEDTALIGRINGILINCPQNSSYIGQYHAPCYINVFDSARMENIQINTLYGIPHDFWIDIDAKVDLQNIEFTCVGIDEKGIVDWNDLGDAEKTDCWNTRAPIVIYTTTAPDTHITTTSKTNTVNDTFLSNSTFVPIYPTFNSTFAPNNAILSTQNTLNLESTSSTNTVTQLRVTPLNSDTKTSSTMTIALTDYLSTDIWSKTSKNNTILGSVLIVLATMVIVLGVVAISVYFIWKHKQRKGKVESQCAVTTISDIINDDEIQNEPDITNNNDIVVIQSASSHEKADSVTESDSELLFEPGIPDETDGKTNEEIMEDESNSEALYNAGPVEETDGKTRIGDELNDDDDGELDIDRFTEWDSKTVLKWILFIEDGLFVKYRDGLKRAIVSVGMSGNDLIGLDREDIMLWGITTSDAHLLQRNIKQLINRSDNVELIVMN